MKKRYCLFTVLFMAVSFVSGAQSTSFKTGQWIEIQNAILKELNLAYVDSLPLDRIERAGVDAMLSALDPYTVYVPKEEDEDLEMMISKAYGGIGAVIYKPEKDGYVIINEPYAGSPAQKYGLKCGDRIMEIDGVSVIGLDSKECSDRMKGKPGTSVTFKIKRVYTDLVEDVEIVRERVHLPDVEYYGMLDDKNGYILQTGFTEKVSQDVREAVIQLKKQGMEKLYLDLRGNGGGLIGEAVSIVSLFVPKGTLVVTSRGKMQGSSYEYKTTSDPVDTEIPIVVLVDNGTASASEIVSGALQDYDRAVIMGTRTYGKGLVQQIRPLPYGGQMKVTTAKYYTPSGRCVQAIDYSSRNADGSVGHIPESMTHEFKTAGGRTVRDGGGITPDVVLPVKEYNRLTYSLVMNGLCEQFALQYVSDPAHKSIAPVSEFHLSDAEYEDFVTFVMGEDFDYRSSAKTLFDQMKKELEKDGLAGSVKEQLDALGKAIDIEKKDFLHLMKSEIIPFIEEEIVVRYYFQAAGIEVRIRYDEQLKDALNTPTEGILEKLS